MEAKFSFQSDSWRTCEAKLKRLYEAPGRYYHNLNHVTDCLDQLNQVTHCEDRLSMKLAIWFHDAIYDPARSDNETASADLAIEILSAQRLASEEIESIANLIQITDHKTKAKTHDEKLIVDIDLSILGRSPIVYRGYSEAIRKEYGHIPDAAYRAGRTAVLETFLIRETIFQTESFQVQYEDHARENIAKEIHSLKSPS